MEYTFTAQYHAAMRNPKPTTLQVRSLLAARGMTLAAEERRRAQEEREKESFSPISASPEKQRRKRGERAERIDGTAPRSSLDKLGGKASNLDDLNKGGSKDFES